MDEIETLKKLLQILERTIDELHGIAAEIKLPKTSQDAYKVKLSKRPKDV